MNDEDEEEEEEEGNSGCCEIRLYSAEPEEEGQLVFTQQLPLNYERGLFSCTYLYRAF